MCEKGTKTFKILWGPNSLRGEGGGGRLTGHPGRRGQGFDGGGSPPHTLGNAANLDRFRSAVSMSIKLSVSEPNFVLKILSNLNRTEIVQYTEFTYWISFLFAL